MFGVMAMRWPDEDHETIEASGPEAFRDWLVANHDAADAVWLMYWKKDSGRPSISWSEAVDQALCFGWIDTKVQSVDDDRYVQYFTRRRPGSPWSRINKAKIEQLSADGLMTDAGWAVIDRAKEDGSWTMMDAAEALIVPDDLDAAFDAAPPAARDYYESMKRSAKLATLAWIYTAKRPETRAKRVAATVEATSEGRPPRPV